MKFLDKIKTDRRFKKYGFWILIFFIVKGTITTLLGVGIIAWIAETCN